MLKVFIRADASPTIGSGHVMRCLALAEKLRERGGEVRFIIRRRASGLSGLVESKGFGVERLEGGDENWNASEDAALTAGVIEKNGGTEWLVADRIGIDALWEKALRPVARRILSIDDLAYTPRECDILVNQNYLPGLVEKYEKIVPFGASLLLGPKYALLRDEFAEKRKQAGTRDGSIRRILISFGGGSNDEAVLKAVEAVLALDDKNLMVDVITGHADMKTDSLRKLVADNPRVTISHGASNMAELTAKADLVIGAFGVSTWERMCLGAPSIIAAVAGIQEPIAQALSTDGYVVYLGRVESVSAETIANAVRELMASQERMSDISHKVLELVDGRGAERVAMAMIPD